MKKNNENFIHTVILTITNGCNLNCRYCYETYKDERKMSEEKAVGIIEKELLNLQYNERLNVSFIGGEPFLNFQLIKNVVEKYIDDDRVFFTCSSNGTLVHGEIKEWIKNIFPKFSYNLSLDGKKEVQDYNRSNSFDYIDLEFYRDLYLEHGEGALVKMTLYPDTLGYLSDSVKFIHSYGIQPYANCAYGVSWLKEETISVFKKEYTKLIQYYLDNPEVIPVSLLNMDFRSLAYDTKYKPWCGLDKMSCYSVDGIYYPCQYFEDITLGKNANKIILEIDQNNLLQYMDEECKECELLNLCPICFGACYKKNKQFNIKDVDICVMFKLQLYANAILKINMIKRYPDRYDSVTIKEVVCATNKIERVIGNMFT